MQGVDRVGGVWKFRTTSWNTVNAILSSLALIKTITGGPLAGIPLYMVLSPKTVTIPTTGQSTVVYVVSLEYRGPEEQLAQIGYEIAKRRIEHQIRMGTVETQARRLLVAPHEETIQDQQETAEEFYPEGVVVETASSGPVQDKKRAPTALSTASVQDHSAAAGTRSQDPGNRGRQDGDSLAQAITRKVATPEDRDLELRPEHLKPTRKGPRKSLF